MNTATEIESSEDTKVFYHTLPNPNANRQKIDVKCSRNTDLQCGSRGRELIKMIRSDSDNHPVQEQRSSPIWKRMKNIVFAYLEQWSVTGIQFRIVFASHLVLWTALLPGIAIGVWLEQQTKSEIGITEVLISGSLSGLVFGLFGSQPIMILGVSIPSAVFIAGMSDTARRLSIDFFPWFAWIGLWCSVLLLFLAASGACRLTEHLTFFSWEVLRLFVGICLVWIGLSEIVRFFNWSSLEASLLSLWLATCTIVLAVALSGAQAWRCLNRHARDLIHNYAPALTFLLFTVLPLLPKFQHIQFERVNMPEFLYRTNNVTKLGTMVSLKSVPMWAILLAFIPGAFLASMIFVDHCTASVVLKYANGITLPEKTPRNWDLFLIAVLTCCSSLFGMPFCYGLSTQSIAHKRALVFHVDVRDEESQQMKCKETVKSQRVSAIIVSVLCGIPFIPGIELLLEKIPLGVIAGMFLEMAYSCLRELKVVRRCKAFFTASNSSNYSSICTRRVYCGIQIVCSLLIFITSRTPAALVFPLFILVVIALRHYVLAKVFTLCGFNILDTPLTHTRDNIAGSRDNMDHHHHHHHQAQLEASKMNSEPAQRALVRSKGTSGHIEIESSSSPHSRGSPSMLVIPSTRRLKERSRRRNKRKRHGSGSAARTEDEGRTDDPEQQLSYNSQASLKDMENMSKESGSGVFGRYKRRALNIELHSNVLYDHLQTNELDENISRSPTATYESPRHRPSPASSQVQQECVNGGSNNSSHASSQSRHKRKATCAVFSTTQNPCFVQEESHFSYQVVQNPEESV